jgi:DNA invertase Pin-like site-specific DNA recombinase
MGIYGYIRVAGGSRSASEAEFEGSINLISRYCSDSGLSNPIYRKERSVSGLVPFAQRPVGKELLGALHKGDVLIAPSFAQLFLSAKDAVQSLRALSEQGVEVHIIDMGGKFDASLQHQSVMVALEAVARERRTPETEEKNKHDATSFTGGDVPFGYQVNDTGQLIPHAEEQLIIVEMEKLRGQGISFRGISEKLSKRTPPVKLSYSGVRKILMNQRKSDQTKD